MLSGSNGFALVGELCRLLCVLVFGLVCCLAKSKPRLGMIRNPCAARDGALCRDLLVSTRSLQNDDGLLVNKG